MRKKAILITLPLITLIVVSVILIFTLSSDDTAILDNLNTNFKTPCFFVSSTGEITGQSTFTMSGSIVPLKYKDSYSLQGNLEVANYPNAFSNITESRSIMVDKKWITISEQGYSQIYPAIDTWYIVRILIEDPDVCMVYISTKGQTINAICGTDKEDALQNYDKYLKNFP